MSDKHHSQGPVIVVTGLRVEARIAAPLAGVRTIVGGGDARHLERLIGQASAEGCSGVVSFGIAAGLTPGKSPGTSIVASEIVHESNRYAAEPAWVHRLLQSLPGAELAVIAGVDRPLRGPAEKQALYARTGAMAADMESHVAARLAAERALPFAGLRVIVDPVERDVPPAALAGMRKDGSVNVWAVLAALARSPRQLPAMLRLSGDMRQAMTALLRCRDRLGPCFGFRNLV